ncbi:MAG TPA: DUF3037 domain-containing protein, partial [Kribbella sp.]
MDRRGRPGSVSGPSHGPAGRPVRLAAGWCTVNLVPFDYVILRAAPRIQRGEFVNVGAVLYCRSLDFLGAAW